MREHHPHLIFLNDVAPYYRTLISRVQELNRPWVHKSLRYMAEFLLPLYTSFYSRDERATGILTFPGSDEDDLVEQQSHPRLWYLRASRDPSCEVDTVAACNYNSGLMDTVTAVVDPAATDGLSEPNFDSYPMFKLYLQDKTADETKSVRENVTDFSRTLFCALNRRLAPTYPLMKTLSMMEPQRWAYFSDPRNRDERSQTWRCFSQFALCCSSVVSRDH